MKLSDLKKSLSACHLTSDDEKVKFLLEVKDPEYFLNRTLECLDELKRGVNVQNNCKLAIQLINLFKQNDAEVNYILEIDGPVQG
jgi:hypothetical protein